MKHMHSLSIIIGVNKTATTACGKRVKFADLAIMQDSDCPECRKHAEEQHDISVRMLAYAKDTNLGTKQMRDELSASVSNGPTYRNAILGF